MTVFSSLFVEAMLFADETLVLLFILNGEERVEGLNSNSLDGEQRQRLLAGGVIVSLGRCWCGIDFRATQRILPPWLRGVFAFRQQEELFPLPIFK